MPVAQYSPVSPFNKLLGWLMQDTSPALGKDNPTVPPWVPEAQRMIDAPEPDVMGAAGMPMRIGVRPGLERTASQIIKRGFPEPLFHGTRQLPEDIMREGFRLPLGGSAKYLGEPAGVSLTKSPGIARGFGQVLRVGLDVPKSSIADLLSESDRELFRGEFEKALGAVKRKPGRQLTQNEVRAVNRLMSTGLQNRGVEAVRYNPLRWAEHEIRALDPAKVIPFGKLPSYFDEVKTPAVYAADRYETAKGARLSEQAGQWTDAPRNLSEILGIPTREPVPK